MVQPQKTMCCVLLSVALVQEMAGTENIYTMLSNHVGQNALALVWRRVKLRTWAASQRNWNDISLVLDGFMFVFWPPVLPVCVFRLQPIREAHIKGGRTGSLQDPQRGHGEECVRGGLHQRPHLPQQGSTQAESPSTCSQAITEIFLFRRLTDIFSLCSRCCCGMCVLGWSLMTGKTWGELDAAWAAQ